MKIKDAITSVFASRVSDRTMTVADATLIYAAGSLLAKNWQARPEEEFITAALFGSLGAAFPLCAEFIGTDTESGAQCYWGQYRKSKAGHGEDKDYESIVGADFALAFGVNDDDFRIAVFQAKTVKNSSIDLHQQSPKPRVEGVQPPPQIVKLAYRGSRIVREALLGGGPDHPPRFAQLSWIHYVAYPEVPAPAIASQASAPDEIRCVALSTLQSAFEAEAREPRGGTHLSIGPALPTLLDTLLAAVADVGYLEFGKPWLRMSRQQAERALPPLVELTNLYFIGEGSDGLRLFKSLTQAGPAVVEQRTAVRVTQGRKLTIGR